MKHHCGELLKLGIWEEADRRSGQNNSLVPPWHCLAGWHRAHLVISLGLRFLVYKMRGLEELVPEVPPRPDLM